MRVLAAYVCASCLCLLLLYVDERRASGPIELELQIAMSYCACVEN